MFGKEVKLPGGLELNEMNSVDASGLQSGESGFVRRQTLRNEARMAYLAAHEEDRLKQANNHRTRPRRGPYEPGQLVYFWRMWPKEKKACWHGPGTVIGYHDGQSRVWVFSGMKMYKCSPEQLRPVTEEQEAMIRLLPQDMRVLQRNVQGRGSGNYIDLSSGGCPPENEEADFDGVVGTVEPPVHGPPVERE